MGGDICCWRGIWLAGLCGWAKRGGKVWCGNGICGRLQAGICCMLHVGNGTPQAGNDHVVWLLHTGIWAVVHTGIWWGPVHTGIANGVMETGAVTGICKKKKKIKSITLLHLVI